MSNSEHKFNHNFDLSMEDNPGEESADKVVLDAATSHEHHHRHHHHHSSHHSHHHQSRKHRKNKWQKSKLGKFVKKHNVAVKLTAAVLLVIIVFGTALLLERFCFSSQYGTSSQSSNVGTVADGEYLYVGLPRNGREHAMVLEVVEKYMAADIDTPLAKILESSSDDTRFDVCKPVHLAFDFSTVDALKSGKLEYSESSNFEDSLFVDVKNSVADIYNLKANCTYYYRLHLTYSDNSENTLSGTFETADYPRILTIDGIRNVRDFGGFLTTDGKTVRQGYLYRGTELDGAVESNYKLTDSGKNEMIFSLGIKHDMDLRASTDSVPGAYVLGANVEHKYYGTELYSGVFTEEGKAAIKEVFSDLADPSSYPAYIHCTYGTDRTGTVCYILGAVLGMSEEDLIKSFELSGLHIESLTRDGINAVYSNLQNYEGSTLKEKAESYLLSTGLSYQEIQSIRDIFLQ